MRIAIPTRFQGKGEAPDRRVEAEGSPGGRIMKRSTPLFLFLLLSATAAVAWAGPAEDIAQVDSQAIQCFNEGNVDQCVALYADDAVSTGAVAPFRLERKEAIQSNYTATFQNFPTRRFVDRQTAIRVYGGNSGVLNRYFTLTLVDREGKSTTVHGRMSVTFAKLAGGWRIVDVHTSRLP
jgi:uncharacterized protein (TIGR02246 family)